MGIRDLPTLADVQADRAKRPNWKPTQTRLERKVEDAKDDAKQLLQWARDVKARDEGRCRVCGVRTLATLERVPKRGEAHHIKSRADKAVRTDVRNGLWCCLKCHQRLHGRGVRLHIIGTAAQLFTVNGKPYLNGDLALTFTEAA
jgi:predicted restriction endonuclease